MISIVCPFYNEKGNLRELFERLTQSAQRLPEEWEILFVDDGSSDGGPEILASCIQNARKASIRMIQLEKNCGLSTALYAGLKTSQGRLLATLDADLQNPPEEIPRLVSLMQSEDMITGIRQNRRDSWLKRISSRAANTFRRFVLKDPIQDIGCSLRVFRREVLQVFEPYQGMHRFFPALAAQRGFKIKQVPVEHHPRKHEKAKYGLANRLTGPLADLWAVKWMLTKKINYRIRSEIHG